MIIAHLAYDTTTLKACVATCFTWYNIAIPHLHHILILRGCPSCTPGGDHPDLLQNLHKLRLSPFVKQLHFRKACAMKHCRNTQFLRNIRAMVDLQELKIAGLDFSQFPAGLGKQLGHFSPTLRSVALCRPSGTRRQLLNFLRLFPMLDDVEISHYRSRWEAHGDLDGRLAPISGRLRGHLTLCMFSEEELLEDIAVAFGGMRFTSMHLCSVRGTKFLLETCAHTLETLRICAYDLPHASEIVFYPKTVF